MCRFVVFMCLLCICCRQGQPVGARGIGEQEKSSSAVLAGENRTTFLDQDLLEKIRIVECKVERNDMGMLVVRVGVQAVGDDNVPVDVKCRYEHQSGKIEETPWTPVVVRCHELIPVNFSSLSPEAVDYDLYFRNAK